MGEKDRRQRWWLLARTDRCGGVEEDGEGCVERAVEIPDVDEVRKDRRKLRTVEVRVWGIQ